jgi:GPH family glycoside/pentoside/hexuronide:cation symporter
VQLFDVEDQLPLVMFALPITIAIFLYPTRLLSDGISKGPAYAAGLLLASLAMILTFFLPQGPTVLIFFLAILAGIGFSGQWVFPGSMVPDVVEIDEQETGERREGVYFGLWAFSGKFTGALGIAVGGWALSLFGYVENVAQTDTALLGIRLFFGLVPAIIIIIATTPLLFRYPITRDSHERLVRELEASGDL